MPEDYVKRLVELAGIQNPVEQPTAAEWRAVERAVQYEFPADFKALVTALGTGRFGSGLYLRNPSATSENVRLSVSALTAYGANLASFEQVAGISFYPAQQGLIVIGNIDRDYFYLRPDRGKRQLSHFVHVDHDLREVSELEIGVSHFIHDLYFGRIPATWSEDLRRAIWREGMVPFFT